MSAAPPNALVEDLLAPLPVACLGWFCLGYNMNDTPGRVDGILQLLLQAGLVQPEHATREIVSQVLARVLQRAPVLIATQPRGTSMLVPFLRPDEMSNHLSPCLQEFAGLAGPSNCLCGNKLVRWRQEEAVFFTLSRGLVAGKVIFLRCFACSAVFGRGLSAASNLSQAGTSDSQN